MTDALPYHRLARTPAYRWWRPLAELALFGALVYATWMVLVPVLEATLGDDENGVPGILKLGLMLAVPTPIAMIAARIMKRPAGSLSSVSYRLRWGWLATCLVAAIAFSATINVIVLALGVAGPERGGWVGWGEFLPLAFAVVIVIPLQCAGEEYAFRGELVQSIGAWVRPPVVAIAISSVLFAAAHGLSAAGFVSVWSFGAVAAYLAIRTGGLEASIALHAVNNVSLFLLDAATGRGDRWLTELNTDITWSGTAVDVVTNVIAAAIIVALYKRRR